MLRLGRRARGVELFFQKLRAAWWIDRRHCAAGLVAQVGAASLLSLSPPVLALLEHGHGFFCPGAPAQFNLGRASSVTVRN